MAPLAQPSTLAEVLLVCAAVVFAELRRRESLRVPLTRSPLWYSADVLLAIALPLVAGPLGSLPVAVVAVVGLLLGVAGMATTGLVCALVFTFGSNPLATWLVAPLLLGVALRNLRLPPDLWVFGPEPRTDPIFPAAPDIFWGVAARAVCVLPLLGVLLIPGPAPWLRVAGAAAVGLVLYSADRGRRPLLMPHRRTARMGTVGLLAALAVVAAGPLGEWTARWWAETPSFTAWEVSRYMFYACGAELIAGPAFHGTRLGVVRIRVLQAVFGALPLVTIVSVTPFLLVGVFHPSHEPLVAATAGLGIGLLWVFAAHLPARKNRLAADVITLLGANPRVRGNLLQAWTTDTFQRQRGWIRRPWDYSLVHACTELAVRCSRAARLTTGVEVQLPWAKHVRLTHHDTTRLLALAEEVLDWIGTRFPPVDDQKTLLGHRQLTARAHLAAKTAEVAQNLDDPQTAYTATRQRVDLLLEAGARTHAALALVEGANYAVWLDDQDTATELLMAAGELDLPPAVRRLLLINWAHVDNEAGLPGARERWAAALALRERSATALKAAIEADPVPFEEQERPSEVHKAVAQLELHLERTFTS
ncbi:hypothetical protein [Actinokineospora diospyrosa]|uniref:Uncharacterized protein n=1 Tax=Actinokineospora diospyrosa TaxID=103728 RepID=A0ABT1I672_9PSEU|nr:hypothetical protein [Actinokineospora diospyrosa]MCP2268069.1 hypothetical protein [Actinokineospora diospyrosa]